MIARVVVLLAAVAATGASAQERVSFPSHDADLTRAEPTALPGLLWRPRGDGPFPAIVLMHGCGGLRLRDGRVTARHREWAERFHGLGYVVLHVDSFEPRGLVEICTVTRPPVRPGIERARDAYGALRYLQTRTDVHGDRVGLLGWSNGGSTVLWTLRDGARARPRDLAVDFAAAVAFYPGCIAALAWREGWTTRIPLLVLSGEADDWTPVEPCRSLAARAAAAGAPVEIVTYAGAHHGFDAPNQRLLVLPNIASTASGTATVGTNPAARADAIDRVVAFFGSRLR